MPDLKKLITLEALEAALPSWLKSLTKPSYNADEIGSTSTTNQFVTSTEKDTWNGKQNALTFDDTPTQNSNNPVKSGGVYSALAGKVDTVSGKGLSTEDYTTSEKNKLSGIADNANNYVHPTSSGYKHIPSGGSSGKVLGWSADGTAEWITPPSGGGSVESVTVNGSKFTPDSNGDVNIGTVARSDTNTYVSAASFADNSSSSTANPLKMTLSRSGSHTTSVTATLPKVSSSTAGVVPKGTSVSSQSQSTKFLRQDGTWAVPSYTANAYNATTIEPCNFNTLTTAGLYLVNQTGSSNLPWTRGEWILLQVFRPTPDNAQHVVQIGRSLNYAGEFCIRHRYSNTWTSWYSFSGTVI